MKSLRLLVILIAVIATSSCFGGNSRTGGLLLPTPIAAAVSGGGRVFLDPFVQIALIGTILLANQLAVGTADGDIVFQIEGAKGVEPEVREVRLAPGETRQVNVFAAVAVVTLAAILTLSVIATYANAAAGSRTFALQWNNETAGSNAWALIQLLGQSQMLPLFFLSTILTPIAILTGHSWPQLARLLPKLPQEIRLIGAMLIFFSLAQLQANFAAADDGGGENFPLGQGSNGLTVKALPALPLQEGDYCAFWMSTSAAIPLADPQQSYQYAFVMDADLNAANNYVPIGQFSDDYFKDTDRWYELTYTPTGGWTVQCKVVGAGNTITTVASAAHMIIRGDTILLFVPRSEFGVAKPPFRATSFCHGGDFGLNPPHEWSGDPTPTVHEPLHAWQ